jgi:hypothetical protein
MTTFDKREQDFERKFALDEELKFKSEARCNRLLGLWAAEQLGLSGDAAKTYASEIVAVDFEAGGAGAARKVKSDLAAGGITIPDDQLRDKMAELLALAVAQVRAGN